MTEDVLLFHVDARGIATATFNRPDVRNAYTGQMLEAVMGVLRQCATDDRVREVLNTSLCLEGIALTMLDERTNLSREVEDEVRSHFGSRVYDTIVPRTVRLAEAPSYGMSILQYDIKSSGAQAYLGLAREFLRRNEL